MSTYSYEYMCVYSTSINTSERLSQFDLKIHKVNQRAPRCRWDVSYH
jgi:hypothetical protein